MTAGDLPQEREAQVDVLFDGYVGDRVAGTVSVIRDGSRIIVVDPGMVPDRRSILDPLESLGIRSGDVTDVVFSHHHPDHTLHAALFEEASFHDHWAIYRNDTWTSRPAEGFAVSPSVRLWATPGHTPQDITTLAATPDGIVAFTHLWWFEAGPPEDPLAVDPPSIHSGRARVMEVANLIVPGHGPAFSPSGTTPA